MMPMLVLVSIFSVGFGVGYAMRAWRSRNRKEFRRTHASYGPSRYRQDERLGARRAF